MCTQGQLPDNGKTIKADVGPSTAIMLTLKLLQVLQMILQSRHGQLIHPTLLLLFTQVLSFVLLGFTQHHIIFLLMVVLVTRFITMTFAIHMFHCTLWKVTRRQ